MAERTLRITPSCSIALDELVWRVSRSGGPGGQHANTSETRVEVVFDVTESRSLGPRQRARLLDRLGPIVRAVSADTRSQARNRELALDRLRGRLGEGLRLDPTRRPTKASRSARTARLDAKRHRSEVKRGRSRPQAHDE